MGVANLVLRGAQVVVTVAELGLAAYSTYRAFQSYEICSYDAFENAVICTEFGGQGISGLGALLLFNCIWTLIILAVLCLVPLCTKLHPIAVAVLDGLTMLFWFSGAVGYAVIVGTASAYIDGGAGALAIPDAMAGLAFVIWALFLASFIINVRGANKARKGGVSQNYGPSAHQQYGPAVPSPGPNNFPMQNQHPGQPHSPDKQGTYVQSMQPMQQQSPMHSPVHSPAPQYQQGMYPPPQAQQYQQPMHQTSPVQQQYQQPMHQPSPVQQQYQQPQQQTSPVQQYQQPMQQPSPIQHQQPMHPQQQQQNQWSNPGASPTNYNPHNQAGGNSAYYNQNPELAHV